MGAPKWAAVRLRWRRRSAKSPEDHCGRAIAIRTAPAAVPGSAVVARSPSLAMMVACESQWAPVPRSFDPTAPASRSDAPGLHHRAGIPSGTHHRSDRSVRGPADRSAAESRWPPDRAGWSSIEDAAPRVALEPGRLEPPGAGTDPSAPLETR